jgi:hypothetical protein
VNITDPASRTESDGHAKVRAGTADIRLVVPV